MKKKNDIHYCDRCEHKCGKIDFTEKSKVFSREKKNRCVLHPENVVAWDALSITKGETRKKLLFYVKDYGIDNIFITIANFVTAPGVGDRLNGDLKKDFSIIRDYMERTFKDSQGRHSKVTINLLDLIENLDAVS